MVTLSPLTAADRVDWQPLWQSYLVFYESRLAPAVTEDVFGRLVVGNDLHGLIARDGAGVAIGFVHWLTHPSTWSTGSYCYLEDLYVDPNARGAGVGAALIEQVTHWAREHGCEKVYWLTQNGNTRARGLYDRVASATGFVHYEVEL